VARNGVELNEAWIFLSIADAGRCNRLVSFDRMLEMADAVSHSFPTAEKLSDSQA
jgi:hypothetical protein